MVHVLDIKLIRTDSTLDFSQKTEKGMNCLVLIIVFYCLVLCYWLRYFFNVGLDKVERNTEIQNI